MVAYYNHIEFEYFQSNIEGELVDYLQKVGFSADGIILNAGAYTHTSVAIRDAISAITTPVVEVHISNILTRESFRHESLIGPVCKGSIMGFGLNSYRLGVESFLVQELWLTMQLSLSIFIISFNPYTKLPACKFCLSTQKIDMQ